MARTQMKNSTSLKQAAAGCDTLSPEPGILTVYYDGACPLCRREVDFYRRRSVAAPIEWVDAAAEDAEFVAPDLARADALARFHVRLPDGTLESGSRGFGELWAVLPGFRWIGTLARSRIARPLLELAYRAFLFVRPIAQRVAAGASRGFSGRVD
jgi:predicted DCC family thiol-disulfide oxidoreductase YuxK